MLTRTPSTSKWFTKGLTFSSRRKTRLESSSSFSRCVSSFLRTASGSSTVHSISARREAIVSRAGNVAIRPTTRSLGKIVSMFQVFCLAQQSMVPIKSVESQQLISHDIHSNNFNYKTTFSVEIAPVCKGDVVCLPAALARQLGT